MTKLAPEWVRTSDPVIRSPARIQGVVAIEYLDINPNARRLLCLDWNQAQIYTHRCTFLDLIPVYPVPNTAPIDYTTHTPAVNTCM